MNDDDFCPPTSMIFTDIQSRYDDLGVFGVSDSDIRWLLATVHLALDRGYRV